MEGRKFIRSRAIFIIFVDHSCITLVKLSLIGVFTWLTPPGPYRHTTCRQRELTLDQVHTFLPHQDMEGHSVWGISSMRGHLRDNTNMKDDTHHSRTHSFIPTRWIWKDDYDGQMIFGDFVGLKLPDNYLIGEEKPRKNLTQETCPDRGSNPGPLRDRRACYRLFHSGGLKCSDMYSNKHIL